MSVSDLMCQIAELSLQVQELERTERDQQDKIGKLREAWDKLDGQLYSADRTTRQLADSVDRALEKLEE